MAWEFDWLYGLQEIHGPVLDKVMILLSSLGNAGLFWIGLSLVLLMIKKYRKTGLQMLITIAVSFILARDARPSRTIVTDNLLREITCGRLAAFRLKYGWEEIVLRSVNHSPGSFCSL